MLLQIVMDNKLLFHLIFWLAGLIGRFLWHLVNHLSEEATSIETRFEKAQESSWSTEYQRNYQLSD